MDCKRKKQMANVLLAAMIASQATQAVLADVRLPERAMHTAEAFVQTDSNAQPVYATDSNAKELTEKSPALSNEREDFGFGKEDRTVDVSMPHIFVKETPAEIPQYYQATDEDGVYSFRDRYGETQYRTFGFFMESSQEPETASDAHVEAADTLGWYDEITKEAIDPDEEYLTLAPYIWEAVPEDAVTEECFEALFQKRPKLRAMYEEGNHFFMDLHGENWDGSRYGVWDFTDWEQVETEEDIQYWFYGHAVNTDGEAMDAWLAVSNGAVGYRSDVYTQAYFIGTDYGNDKTSGTSTGGVWVTGNSVYEKIQASAVADAEHNRIIINVYKINKKASGSKEVTNGNVGEVHLLLGDCHDVFIKKNKPKAGSYYPVSTNHQGKDVGDIDRISYTFSSNVGEIVKPKADYYRSTDPVKLNSEYVNLKRYAKDAADAPYIETQYYGLGTETMSLDIKEGIFSICIYNPPEDLTDVAFTMQQYNYYDHQEDGDSSHYQTAFIHVSDINGVDMDGTVEEFNKAKEVTLSFDGNGGTAGKTSMTAEPGKAIGALPSATRTGYTFAGWYTATTGGSRITEQTAAPEAAATYYAHWTVNRYTATFHSAGSNNGASITRNYQEAFGTLPTTERTGYRFKGWYTAENGGNAVTSATKMGSANVEYYAQWEANRFMVVYDANGGTGRMGISTFTYGAENTLSANAFAKTGYHFAGWAREPEGEIVFRDNAKAGSLTSDPDATLYLYAVWEANPYSVTLHRNLDGGDDASVVQQYQYDREYRLPENVFEKTGYTFTGWTAGRDGSGESHEDGAKVHNWAESGTIDLYAQWTPNPYRLYYGANGGQVEHSHKEVIYDAAIGELPVPKRTNYRFIGWTLHGKPVEAANLYQTAADSYAYAQWELNFKLQEETNTNIRPGKDDAFGTGDDEIYTNGPDGIPNTEDDREVFPGKDGVYGTEDDYYILNPPYGDRIYAGADKKFNTPDDYIEKGNGLILHPGEDCYFGEEPGAPAGATGDNEIWWKGDDGKTGTKDTIGDDRLVHAGKDGTYGTGDDYIDEEDGKNRRPGKDGAFGTENDIVSFNGRDTLPGTDDDFLHFEELKLNHRPGEDCIFDTAADSLADAGDDTWYWDGEDGLPGTADDIAVYPGADGVYGTPDDFYQYPQVPYKGNKVYAGKDGTFGTEDDYMENGEDGRNVYPGPDRKIGTDDDRIDTGKGTNTSLSGEDERTNGKDGIPGTADDEPILTDPDGNPYVDNGDGTVRRPGPDGIWGTEDDENGPLKPETPSRPGKPEHPETPGDATEPNPPKEPEETEKPGESTDPVKKDEAGNPYIDNGDGSITRPGEDEKFGTEDDGRYVVPADKKPGEADQPIHVDGSGNPYIDNGDGTITRPGNDQVWNTKDDEKWFIGSDGKPGTADDKPVKTDANGKDYVDNGNGTLLRPGNDGQFGTKDDEIWNVGPDKKPGTADDYRPGKYSGSGGGNGSSGGRDSSTRAVHAKLLGGKWVLDSTGWWYSYENGTWPKAQWAYLKWQERTDWYYFGADGYMKTGWYLDMDGSWYYLHLIADGTRGHMYTGWHLIDGKYYCFADSGRLYVNCVTPDGYTVNADGVWIP